MPMLPGNCRHPNRTREQRRGNWGEARTREGWWEEGVEAQTHRGCSHRLLRVP
ncbi:hypothetical protein D623_10017018 [Myotis brandtii]|uniref:Uncharacterized protein n=1 Tax=Myotis brandtii TaxID=109478 RepID=S7MWG2_MYOBR|nr:hypothetical protein D623_10017018 [Myotis brandtii]